ncbi:MAG TPA: FAD-binding oxidoreductase [Gaiellaceae bacterium]|nr:FAD-binding oxidoreductase [Gaiellaceae bacterium]
MTVSHDSALLDDLAGQVSGRVLRPADVDYDTARRVHNGLVDRSPAVIVRCRTAADVAAAVRFARAAGLDVSVRGGGHNVAGRAVADDAVMIDLAEMKGTAIDAGARTVRAEGGLLWAELNAATAAHGLAVTGGAISTTGIAGLTLGGGLGWLMAKYGLAADNVLAVELVTAEGEVLDVTEESHPDLFWALRGGGGNFGVATTFTYRLHPLETVTGGIVAHPVDAAPDLLRFYRDAVAGASDDLTVFAALVHAPDGSGAKLSAFAVFHTGDEEQAEKDLEPFTTWGSPLMVEVGRMPYPVMNTLLDGGYPAGSLNYWLSSFTRGLSDGLIDTMVERFASVPSPMSAILLEHFHGAVTRVGVGDTAVPHRSEGWNLLLPSVWMDPAASAENIAWTRETHTALGPHLDERRWLNYLGDDQDADAVRAAYGPNWERLRDVKRRYDPDNVFHHNHNIDPA